MILAWKLSGKPFKSGAKINTVKEETINPHTGLPAWTFEEDDSIVDQRTCFTVNLLTLDTEIRHLLQQWELACPARIHEIRNRGTRLGFLYYRLTRKEPVYDTLMEYKNAVYCATQGNWEPLEEIRRRAK